MAEDSHYAYTPSIPVAAITIVAFSILTLIHTCLLFKKRTWFCIPFIIGGILEVIGYVGRAIGHSKPASLPPYIMQALLILLAPILFAASVYMFLGRIVRATGCESCSMVRPSWLTKGFVTGDILCFLIQAVGGGMLASAKNKAGLDRGKVVILFGLVLQIVIFGFFMLVAAVFHLRVRNRSVGETIQCSWNWEQYLRMLYVVSVIITTRNLFRVIEYAMGNDGYLMVNEWPIYVFDALLMATVLGLTCLWHVGQITFNKRNGNREDVELTRGKQTSANGGAKQVVS